MKYWIKERHSSQLGVYYVACGLLSNADAKMESTLYGNSVMTDYDTEEEYQTALKTLRDAGVKVY